MRSIHQNLGDLEEVVIAGYIPPWVQKALLVPVASMENKYRSAEANLRQACLSSLISDPFYLFNDDFFLMQPYPDGIPVMHWGSLEERVQEFRAAYREGKYTNGMTQTWEFLKQLLPPWRRLRSYELHTPLLVEKQKMLHVLSLRPRHIEDFHLRTVYGNLFLRGSQSDDVKVYLSTQDAVYEKWPMISTTDSVFRSHPAGDYIRRTFPTPSPYEATTSHTYLGETVVTHPK